MTPAAVMEDTLCELFILGEQEGVAQDVSNVMSYENAGLMSREHGLVVLMEDGTEFQITIVQSR